MQSLGSNICVVRPRYRSDYRVDLDLPKEVGVAKRLENRAMQQWGYIDPLPRSIAEGQSKFIVSTDRCLHHVEKHNVFTPMAESYDRINAYHRLVFTVTSMEVGRTVITVKHADQDAEELTNPWHVVIITQVTAGGLEFPRRLTRS